MIRQKHIWAIVGFAGLFCGGALAAGKAGDKGAIRHVSKPIPGRYIVVLHDDVANVSLEAHVLSGRHDGRTRQLFQHALKGFSVDMTEADALRLSFEPQVESVEQDRLAYLPEVEDVEQDNPASLEVDRAVAGYTWGLDRIDQRDLPLDGSYHSVLTGAGIKAYVIDSGIRSTHVDFGGRVIEGYSFYANGTEDCHGHGTHVAGTLGGFKWGVAKEVTLVPVKIVYDCKFGTSLEATIAGVDWVTGDHVAGQPAVANMSIQWRWVDMSLDKAVNGSIEHGIVYVVAAGNHSSPACVHVSPARVPAAITVAWSTRNDWASEFSNWGPCVDLYAPGDDITSAGIASDTATDVMSGTSMASPHAAGAAALYLQSYPGAKPADVSKGLIKISTKGRIYIEYGWEDTPNRLTYRPAP